MVEHTSYPETKEIAVIEADSYVSESSIKDNKKSSDELRQELGNRFSLIDCRHEEPRGCAQRQGYESRFATQTSKSIMYCKKLWWVSKGMVRVIKLSIINEDDLRS